MYTNQNLETSTEDNQLPKFKLQSFAVKGLNDILDIELLFDDNKLVLIGENGTSKSTLLTMLYFVLARQLERLQEIDFKEITIQISKKSYRFSYPELQSFIENITSKRNTSRFNLEILRACKNAGLSPETVIDDPIVSKEIYLLLRKRFPISESRFKSGLIDLIHTESDVLSGDLPTLISDLREIDLQIVFLPTYRRIERDLKTLFPNLEDAIRERNELRPNSFSRNLVELVEFGMEDVERLINNKLNLLRGTFQEDVNNLFGEYLRDVLRGSYESVTASQVADIDSTSLSAILGRLDEQTLPARDRANLREKVEIFQSGKLASIADQVVAHFLVKLHSLQKTQLGREESFRNFVQLCNSYLTGKIIEFDSVTFQVKISLQEGQSKEKKSIELSDLSSGEKQVISLFAHLSMGPQKDYFLLIDEPELSLSVPWQRRFLMDLSTTKYCTGFFAVTHSPFIYDNKLEAFAHGINEFARPQ